MREIKFRGKSLSNNEFVYGSLVFDVNNEWYIHYDNSAICINYNKVIPETISQYTGLKDKNGKEIYEGDIMKVSPPIWAKGGIFKVIYDNGRFIIEDNKVWQNIGTLIDYSEVIGNIYENPELLV